MLFLIFHLGQERYALDVTRVTEVLPFVEVRPIPHAPAGVAGLFNFRGTAVPVIDVSQLAVGRPARRRLSTRLIVVRYPVGHEDRSLGLVVEGATETVRKQPADFVDAGIANARAPYLGPVATDARGLLQQIDLRTLLSEPIRDVLFTRLTDA